MAEEEPTDRSPAEIRSKPKFFAKLSAEIGGVALVVALINALLGGVVGEAVGEGWEATKQWMQGQPTPTPTDPAPTKTGPQKTDVRFVRIFDEDTGALLPQFTSSTRHTGHCVDGYVSADVDALRCFASDPEDVGRTLVLDPCWDSGWDKVACPPHPWSSSVRIVEQPQVEGGSPSETPRDLPWALEIQDPTHPPRTLRCLFQAGAGKVIDNKRRNWSCWDKTSATWRSEETAPEQAAGFAYGKPVVRENEPWLVYYADKDSTEGAQTPITTVWR